MERLIFIFSKAFRPDLRSDRYKCFVQFQNWKKNLKHECQNWETHVPHRSIEQQLFTIAIKSALWSRIQNIGQSSRIDPYGYVKRPSKLSPVILNIKHWATLKKQIHR